MKSLHKIPATVITGFLGAGKTTLVRHLMENAGGKRIALVINEFGDLGVDRDILAACGVPGCEEDNIIELPNGCICCTVADEFLPTMQALINRADPPDHIVIETSGLALPKPLVKAFNWPEIRSRVTVDGVVAVLDAPAVVEGRFADDPDAVQVQRESDDSLDHDNPLEEVYTDQILCADMVLLNKADLIDEPGLDTVLKTVTEQVRSGVKVVPTHRGQMDPRVLLGIGAAAEDDLENRPSHHETEEDHDHDDFESFHVDLGAVTDLDGLEARLHTAITEHNILRIKGFIDVPGKPMRHLVQAVGPRLDRYYDRAWKAGEDRRSRLVVIGLHGLDRESITARILGTAA